MKILQVITTLTLAGAEKLVSEISPLLQEKGNKVEVCTFVHVEPNLNDALEKNGVKVINFSKQGSSVYNPIHILKLARLMRSYDVVHTHNTACQMFAAIGSILIKFSERFTSSGSAQAQSGQKVSDCPKLVTTEHSTSSRRRKFFFFKIIDKWMYSRYNKIICISEPAETSLRGYIGNNYPIETIENGVNLSKFIGATPINLGFGEVKIITIVAAFRYEKDHPTVINALKYLPVDFHLVLVGDGERRLELETLIHSCGLTGRVHLLGRRNDVPNILKASDVIVMSSHREGLSLSNVEGMCSGHPFVASDVEGLREVTKGYGLLFPHGDSKALADIILRLCTDKAYADEVAARCKERALQYDINKMVEGYQKVYESLIK